MAEVLICVRASVVSLHVQSQVVWAREGSLAEHTLVRFLTRVLAVVTCQLIRAGKFPAAALPWTVVRLFTCVGAKVSLEVRALGVGLAAAGVFTAVDGWSLFPRSSSATLPFQPTRGQLLSNQQRLLVQGQMPLAVVVVTVKAGSVVKVGQVAVVSRVRGHRLRSDEPVFRDGYHWRLLLLLLLLLVVVIVGVEVPWCDLTEASSAVSFNTSSLGEVKLIYVMHIRK